MAEQLCDLSSSSLHFSLHFVLLPFFVTFSLLHVSLLLTLSHSLAKQISLRSSAPDLHSGSAPFESRPGYQLS
jgi:hypothetical protein